MRWSVKVPGDALGGATVAGDVVFTSTFQGLLLGYDRATGEEVWRYQAPGFVNGWPAVVGDTIVWPISGTDPSTLLAFRLPPAPPTTSTTSPTTAPTAAPVAAGSAPAGAAGAATPVAARGSYTG